MPPSFSRHSKRLPLPPNSRVTKQSALLYLIRVSTAQGKQAKWQNKIPVREFGNFAKTQGIWFSQVVYSLILKVKHISIFAAKISNFF